MQSNLKWHVKLLLTESEIRFELQLAKMSVCVLTELSFKLKCGPGGGGCKKKPAEVEKVRKLQKRVKGRNEERFPWPG